MNLGKIRIPIRLLMLGAVLLIMGYQAFAAQGILPAHLPAMLEKLPEPLRQNEAVQTDLKALLTTYGPAIKGVESKAPNKVYLIMQDGQKIVYDDGGTKSFEEKLRQPDLQDMLSQMYKPGKPTSGIAPDHDPGRIRVQAFFNAVYGDTAGPVQANLMPVNFAGVRVSFNSKNGAAAALAKVGERLSRILAQDPGLRSYLFPLGGSYNRRQIAGTDRLSPHSWGIALDLHKGKYWRWGKNLGPMELLALQTAYPWEIVAAFEEQGFIWGGKWYHYDTMHFEYRPELLAKARLTNPGR
jgi:hypothetical protein